MENLGERLVGDYLRDIETCDFVEFNVYPKDTIQVELDVVGIRIAEKHAYICEVATMLETGLQYPPDTSGRLFTKFTKAIDYGNHIFPEWKVDYMLWSPVVKEPNQKEALELAQQRIEAERGIKIILMINEKYLKVIDDLRQRARDSRAELKSPLMRFLQIEGRLKR